MAAEIAEDPADAIADHLDQAHRFAHASGIPEFRDGVDRLAAAWAVPEVPGGVVVLIEPTRFSDALNPIHTRPRTVRISPNLVDGVLRYTLRIDRSRYQDTIPGPAELAVYLFAASLRRDWFESKRAGGARGRELLDTIIGDSQGMLGAQFRTWDRVIEVAYLPLRARNAIAPVPELESLAEGRAACRLKPDPEGCWQSQVRVALNLREPQ